MDEVEIIPSTTTNLPRQFIQYTTQTDIHYTRKSVLHKEEAENTILFPKGRHAAKAEGRMNVKGLD